MEKISVSGNFARSGTYSDTVVECSLDLESKTLSVETEKETFEFSVDEIKIEFCDLGYYVPGIMMVGNYLIGSKFELKLISNDEVYQFIPQHWDRDVENMFLLVSNLIKDEARNDEIWNQNNWLNKTKYNIYSITYSVISLIISVLTFVVINNQNFIAGLSTFILLLLLFFYIIPLRVQNFINKKGENLISQRNKYFKELSS